jgi:hypothetical protein
MFGDWITSNGSITYASVRVASTANPSYRIVLRSNHGTCVVKCGGGHIDRFKHVAIVKSCILLHFLLDLH